MHSSTVEIIASVFFVAAILHSFSVKGLRRWARRFPEGSFAENILHWLGEVEIAFGLWAGLLLLAMTLFAGKDEMQHYLKTCRFTEPAFVFAIMAVASTKPILDFATRCVEQVSHLLPLPRTAAFVVVALMLGPLMGSVITEPAAMTMTAVLLRDQLFSQRISASMRYGALGVLMVNISIGGVLTHFAAPPVVMVSQLWGWDTPFMFKHFGWKALLAIVFNTGLFALLFKKGLQNLSAEKVREEKEPAPFWLQGIHLIFLLAIILSAHEAIIFLGVFCLFLGAASSTKEHQAPLKLRESLLVGFFLAGLVVLGGLQRWWLEPFIQKLFSSGTLFLGATVLTAFNDNAAITYLGSRIPDLSESYKYALVAGAVAGGGLTVIANAPNPAGFAILQKRFGPDGIGALNLLLGALPPTLIAMACLWLLP